MRNAKLKNKTMENLWLGALEAKETRIKYNLDFSLWLIEQAGTPGFHYFGEGMFRYNYRSPYDIKEMLNIYKKL